MRRPGRGAGGEPTAHPLTLGRRDRRVEIERRGLCALLAAWAHRTVVRPSDADSLGHINNAKYLFFVEDAKDAAARAGVLPPTDRWSITNTAADARETTEVYIDYTREVKPYDELAVHVWRSVAATDGIGFDFVRGDTVVTRIRSVARPLARL